MFSLAMSAVAPALIIFKDELAHSLSSMFKDYERVTICYSERSPKVNLKLHTVNNWAFSSVLALQFAGVVLRPLVPCSTVAPGEHVVVQFIRWARTLADAAARVLITT